jgi:hypothetical protein
MKTVIELRGGCTRAFGARVHAQRKSQGARLEAARRCALEEGHGRARVADPLPARNLRSRLEARPSRYFPGLTSKA